MSEGSQQQQDQSAHKAAAVASKRNDLTSKDCYSSLVGLVQRIPSPELSILQTTGRPMGILELCFFSGDFLSAGHVSCDLLARKEVDQLRPIEGPRARVEGPHQDDGGYDHPQGHSWNAEQGQKEEGQRPQEHLSSLGDTRSQMGLGFRVLGFRV